MARHPSWTNPQEAGSALLGRISVPAPILAQSLPRSLDLTGRVPASTLRGTALSSKLDHASAALCLCIPEPDTPEGGGARAEGEPAGKEEPSLDALVRMLAARAQAALLRSRSGDLFALEPLSATHATAQLTPLCASAWEDLTRGPCGPRGRFDPCEPSPSAGLARSRGSRRASRATDSQGATGLSAMEKRILLDARDRPAGRGVAAQWGRGWVLTPTGAAMRQRMRCLDVLSAAPGGGPSAGTPHGHGVSGRGGVSAPWEGLEGEADAQTPPLPMRGGATPVTEGVAGEEADGAGTVCVHGACAGEMAARVSKEREDLRIARGR